MTRIILLIAAIFLISGHVMAVEPDEILEDPALEARARAISEQLRCVVCQNENIDSSNAPLARDMRILVRERIVAGDSDQQVYDYLVSRYGEFVLLRPRFEGRNLILWFAPAIALIIGAGMVIAFYRRNRVAGLNEPLTPEESDRLTQILERDDR